MEDGPQDHRKEEEEKNDDENDSIVWLHFESLRDFTGVIDSANRSIDILVFRVS